MRILIIEDDREAAAYMAKAFRETGHITDQAHDGLDGYAMASDGGYDVLVVDRMLPKLDGLSLIRSLREQKVDTPVLILSALGQVDDRVKGLPGRRGRLSVQALCLLGTAGESGGAGPPARQHGPR
jgi:two-component system OmpR family response regulator